jgi:arogenate dehydrogenase (NADP+)
MRGVAMQIGIVGLGLIGGSLGYDLRSLGHEVVGVSQRDRTCQVAVERGIVDRASQDLAALSEAVVIFICTPIGLIQPTVERLVLHLPPETILTDVGSVKGPIVEAIAPLWPNFIGGHPMAGTAESGVDAALRQLFAENPYVLTPTADTLPESLKTLESLVRSLNANLLHCDPWAHDRAVAWISHLPVMVSASLIAGCMGERDPQVLALAQALASSGFRDTSRVGGGNPELGLMMAQYNQTALLETLHQYRDQLDRMIEAIATNQWDSLTNTLQQTQTDRPKFLKE